jgi:phospholipase C
MNLRNVVAQITTTVGGLLHQGARDRGTTRSSKANIQHVIVLMLENRSFDHMLGNLRAADYAVDGLTGREGNYADPVAQTGQHFVTNGSPYVPDVDPSPSHEFHDVMLQIYRQFIVPNKITTHNDGFAYDYAKVAHDVSQAGKVMQCFGSDQLPALHTLAREFAICDKWFSSLPGPTWPNRFFVHCATSGGYVDNALRAYDMRTIFQNLSDAQVSWRVYYHDIPQSLALTNQRQYATRYYEAIGAFFRDCTENTLPGYSFLEPRYFNGGANRANDQHPIHGVAAGDNLIADVYEALRSSPAWENTLLLITSDEHGGFYDHVLPPSAVNPDGKNAPEFDFSVLGVRVPAVVVSPFIPARTIDSTVYEHSSVAATLRKLFRLPRPLTKRDDSANTFDSVLTLSTPRTDCPTHLPRLDMASDAPATAPESSSPTEVHASLTALAESLNAGGHFDGHLPQTESEAGSRARSAFGSYLAAASAQAAGAPPNP